MWWVMQGKWSAVVARWGCHFALRSWNWGIGIAAAVVTQYKLLLVTRADVEEHGYTSVVRSSTSLNAEEVKVF